MTWPRGTVDGGREWGRMGAVREALKGLWMVRQLLAGWRMTSKTLLAVLGLVAGISTIFLCLAVPKRRRELIWGPTPIINNKYWSAALREVGWQSTTLMHGFYGSINKRDDYDLYFEDLIPRWLRASAVGRMLAPLCSRTVRGSECQRASYPFLGGSSGPDGAVVDGGVCVAAVGHSDGCHAVRSGRVHVLPNR